MIPTTLASMRARLRVICQSTLLMNAFYIMLSTFVMAAAGLLFWVLVTRSHNSAAVGLATTLLSISSLLSLLSLAGFDTTFVRFLPGSDRKNDYINSGLIVVTLISAALATGLAVALPHLSRDFMILTSPWAFGGFVFFTVVTSLNVLTNAVFLAFKRARYILLISALFSAFKMVLPLFAVSGGAMTIFAMAGSAQVVGLALSIIWMKRHLAYRFLPNIHVDALRVVRKFSFLVYLSSVLNLLPPTLLPLIIVRQMGPASAAYYYMAFTIAGVLYTIAYASMQSVFAEGSHNEAAIGLHIAKAGRFIAALLLPAVLLAIVLSNWLLTAFGHEYALRANALLQLLAASALPVAAYSALGAIFKVTKNLRGIVSMNVAYALVILGLSYVLMPRLGLMAVGWAWVVGNVVACCVGATFLININNKRLGV